MISISFGSWSSASGAIFVRKRIYWHGFRWTPFVRVFWRYCRNDSMQYSNHTPLMHSQSDVLRIQRAEVESANRIVARGDTDFNNAVVAAAYARGLYNGMLMVCCTHDDAEFIPFPPPQ